MTNFFPIMLFSSSKVIQTLVIDSNRHPTPANVQVCACAWVCVSVCVCASVCVCESVCVWECVCVWISSVLFVKRNNFELSDIKVLTIQIISMSIIEKGANLNFCCSSDYFTTADKFKQFWCPKVLELIWLGLYVHVKSCVKQGFTSWCYEAWNHIDHQIAAFKQIWCLETAKILVCCCTKLYPDLFCVLNNKKWSEITIKHVFRKK